MNETVETGSLDNFKRAAYDFLACLSWRAKTVEVFTDFSTTKVSAVQGFLEFLVAWCIQHIVDWFI
jgi:hypothetical protein